MKHLAMHNLFLYVVCTTCLYIVIAQDPCSGPSNIHIEFPELDPPSPVPSTDTRFAQVIFSDEPDSVTIEDDPDVVSNQFPFDDYFTHSYNSVGSDPGYTVYMIRGIDRDGPTCAVNDDPNVLQYRVVCRSTPTSDPLYKVLKIQIKDENDNAPEFLNPTQSISISESTPVHTTFCSTSFATCDLDEGPNKQVSYSLMGSCTSHFSVSSTGGVLSVINRLDYESSNEFDCVITAIDGGNPGQSSSTSFTINVETGSSDETTFVNCSENDGSLPGSSSLLFLMSIAIVFLFSNVISS